MSIAELANELETLTDVNGIKTVLDTLGTVCREKADHLRTNWQDDLTAKAWETVADKIDKATLAAGPLP